MSPKLSSITTLLATFWMSAFLIAFTIQYGALYDFYIGDITRYSRVFEAIVILSYVLLSAYRFTLTWVFGVAGFALLALYHLAFIGYSGLVPNFNSLFGFMPCLAFVPLAESRLSWRRICDIVFWVSLGYIVLYVVSYNSLVTAALYAARVQDVPGGVFNSGDYRGSRVFLAALSVTFVVFYAVHNKHIPAAVRVLAIGAGAAAAYLSGSRSIGALFVLVLALDIFRAPRRPVAIGLVVLFLAVSVAHLWGLVDPSWNPYVYFSDDISALGRQAEYGPAVAAVQRYGFTGTGIEPDSKAMTTFLHILPGQMPVFFGDLAALGVLGQFGILGLVIFLFASVASILSVSQPGDDALTSVRWNCLLSALYGMIAPSILFPPASFYTCLLFASWLRRRRAARRGE